MMLFPLRSLLYLTNYIYIYIYIYNIKDRRIEYENRIQEPNLNNILTKTFYVISLPNS